MELFATSTLWSILYVLTIAVLLYFVCKLIFTEVIEEAKKQFYILGIIICIIVFFVLCYTF